MNTRSIYREHGSFETVKGESNIFFLAHLRILVLKIILFFKRKRENINNQVLPYSIKSSFHGSR